MSLRLFVFLVLVFFLWRKIWKLAKIVENLPFDAAEDMAFLLRGIASLIILVMAALVVFFGY